MPISFSIPSFSRKVKSAPSNEVRKPKEQSGYIFTSDQWSSCESNSPAPTTVTSTSDFDSALSDKFTLISWNIDMMTPYGTERMSSALNHLAGVSAEITEPMVIFFQEMDEEDLELIQKASWIQERFCITDLNGTDWGGSGYGTTTLVDKRLKVRKVFRLPFPSRYHRDGLFVDLALGSGDKVVRLCNVHLDSMKHAKCFRPKQVALAAEYMRDDAVHGAALAGDCNSIVPADRTLHEENGLKDAFLELGGKEDTEEGYTWGRQSRKSEMEKYPPDRLDKVMFCGNLRVRSLLKVGEGVVVEDEEKRQELVEDDYTPFVTDHLGLRADFELTEGALALIS
jgi:tyrosyl-DNA phosphodiesterase 2